MDDLTFYKDDKKSVLKPELFSDIAEKLAEKFAGSSKSKNKRSQIRKFYDEVLRLNAMAKADPDDWENILPFVNMLIAKTAYAEGRNLVTEDFVDFMKKSIAQIQNPEDLNVFSSFFESLIGFYTRYRHD